MPVPARVNVPVPTFVRPPVPVMLPLKVVDELVPVVSVPEPKVTLPPVVPPPARDPIALLLLLRLRVTPAVLAKLTSELPEKAFTAPACNTPTFTVVVPE